MIIVQLELKLQNNIMCGIFAILATTNNIVPSVIAGLKKLEYRGYDSAGIAYIQNSSLHSVKVEGKITALEAKLQDIHCQSHLAISHTRWATHGAPVELNAHPIYTANFAVVQNGIIENYNDIKKELIEKGITFSTDTDTEVIPQLLQYHYQQGNDITNCLIKTIKQLQGRFSFLAIHNKSNTIYCCTNGAPLIIGKAEGLFAVSSDPLAMADITTQLFFPEEKSLTALSLEEPTRSFNFTGEPLNISFQDHNYKATSADKGEFEHYMLKEIYEESDVIRNILSAYYNAEKVEINLELDNIKLENYSQISIIACGTSYHSGLIAQRYFEALCEIKTNVETASEFRYKKLLSPTKTLFIFISQSGETADTLAALEYVKQHNGMSISLVNVAESAIAKRSDIFFRLLAGPEIGVASTKAFTAQCLCLILIAWKLAYTNGKISKTALTSYANTLYDLPAMISDIIAKSNFEKIIPFLAESKLILFIGRGIAYPLALEGALKFKEITYIPSEGIAAGELKHGPIALIDSNTPIIAIAPDDELLLKTISNIHEMKSRNGKIILIASQKGYNNAKNVTDYFIEMPSCSEYSIPLLYSIPLQLISYYTAKYLEREIDQPRNLAKSVTVE